MNKMYSMKTSLMLLLIFFLNICQIALAQTDAASTDVSRAATVSADMSKSTVASAASAQASKSANEPVPKVIDQSPPASFAIKIRNRTNEIFNRVDYRAIKYIKWPQDKLKENPFENPAKTVEEMKSIADKYCRMFASQYAGEAEKSLGLPKGSISLYQACDIQQVALKNVDDVEDIALVGAWMLYEFDRELFKQYHFGNHKLHKLHKKSLFGLIGIPFNYSDFVLQVLIILSLGLNFFLLYKVLEKR